VTVVQLHPSSEPLELHMDVAGPEFARFADLLTLVRVDRYGTPSEGALELMRRKTELLGNAPVVVNELHAGFIRLKVARVAALDPPADGLSGTRSPCRSCRWAAGSQRRRQRSSRLVESWLAALSWHGSERMPPGPMVVDERAALQHRDGSDRERRAKA
jgi:hypothetical protein